MLFDGIVLPLGKAVPRYIEHALEFAVGVMLIVLGIDVMRRLVILSIHCPQP